MKKILLASAGTQEGIIKMIARFWYNEPSQITLGESIDGVARILRNGKEVKDFQVTTKGARLRFEGLIK